MRVLVDTDWMPAPDTRCNRKFRKDQIRLSHWPRPGGDSTPVHVTHSWHPTLHPIQTAHHSPLAIARAWGTWVRIPPKWICGTSTTSIHHQAHLRCPTKDRRSLPPSWLMMISNQLRPLRKHPGPNLHLPSPDKSGPPPFSVTCQERETRAHLPPSQTQHRFKFPKRSKTISTISNIGTICLTPNQPLNSSQNPVSNSLPLQNQNPPRRHPRSRLPMIWMKSPPHRKQTPPPQPLTPFWTKA